jgi:UDP-GlcNAc:undecaprenyl-phosphate/decaprenyl-phosphate GlcNAc-1-phosphate transferase
MDHLPFASTSSIPLVLFLQVFLLSSLAVALLTPIAIIVGKRLHLVAVPGGRRKHVGRVVRIGGLGLYPAFALGVLLPVWRNVPRQDTLEITRLMGVLIGMGIVWLVGLLDDIYDLPSWGQALGLLIASGVAISFRVFIEVFNSPLNGVQVHVDWYLMLPITLVWIAGMAGTMNVLDGLDGLAAGVTAIASAVLFLHMLRLGQHTVSLLPLALLATCLGFLPYNLQPARIFLGGGAYVLGFGLATLSIVSGAKVASALLVLWVPLLDVLWQVYSRWRRGGPIGLGDRGHLHFRLHDDLGWPMRRVVWLYYVISGGLGAVALLASSRLLKLGVLLVAALLILILFFLLSRQKTAST